LQLPQNIMRFEVGLLGWFFMADESTAAAAGLQQ